MRFIYKNASPLSTDKKGIAGHTFFRTFFCLATCCLVAVSCTKNFDEINTNPNNAETTRGTYLFMTNIIIKTAYAYQHQAYQGEPASAGRYITMVRNEGNDKFGWGPGSWDQHYLRLSNNKEFHDLADANRQDQYAAVAKIMNVFNFAYITDLYGDIPYSEALLSKTKQNIHPKYDLQESIYPDLLRQLKEANDTLAVSANPINEANDVLYHGDATKWRKFANSLRLRLLMRASKTHTSAFADMQEIVNDKAKYPVFESNEDDAEIPYLGGSNDFKWAGGPTNAGGGDFGEFNKRKPSKELVDFLLQRDDPRLPVLVAPVAGDVAAATVDHNNYVGVPNSISAPYDYNGGDEHISLLASIFNEDQNSSVRASMMTYPEVCFILAEAAQKGGITVPDETAESLYKAGIASSMKYWGVELTDGYYNQPSVSYDGSLKQLIGQKWMALFIKGAEGWFDYRRTGFPEFTVGPIAAQSTIPNRFIYPDAERQLNREQYDKAIAIFGTDDRNTKMWYLK